MDETQRACNVCKKAASQASLKRCAKRKTAQYCSRECQKADWKSHKKNCAQFAAIPKQADLPPVSKSLDTYISNPFTRLQNGAWLHDRSEKDVYQLLIDSYRLRMDDKYTYEGEADQDSIYGGASSGIGGFNRFLRLALRRPGLLPPWWTPEKAAECRRLGATGGSNWSDLSCAIEKSDVIEHYDNAQFPMQLRMLAEAVYDSGLGGASGKAMMDMMAEAEQNQEGETQTHVSTIDMTTMGASRYHS